MQPIALMAFWRESRDSYGQKISLILVNFGENLAVKIQACVECNFGIPL
jgi:hypothetical protein